MQKIKQQNGSPETWSTKLKAYFARYEGAIIAYSGGVDSALLAYVAHLALGSKCWLQWQTAHRFPAGNIAMP